MAKKRRPPDPSRKARRTAPTPFALAVGALLARLREAKGLGRYELARALGVSHVRVYEWEKGERIPHTEYLALITQALGTSLGTLDELRSLARTRRPPSKQEQENDQ